MKQEQKDIITVDRKQLIAVLRQMDIVIGKMNQGDNLEEMENNINEQVLMIR